MSVVDVILVYVIYVVTYLVYEYQYLVFIIIVYMIYLVNFPAVCVVLHITTQIKTCSLHPPLPFVQQLFNIFSSLMLENLNMKRLSLKE